MSALLVGYARVSTDQDLTAQRDALAALGVPVERTYVDHGLTATNRHRPGLREALAACRSGDTLVVTKLDRLARSLPDASDILEDPAAHQGGDARRKGQRASTWSAAEAQPRQEEHLVMLHRAGEHSTAELSDLFGVARSTVYRVIERDGRRRKRPSAPRPESARR